MTTPRCISLKDIGDAEVGGKAAGLGRLIAMGLRVPDGFVVVDATLESLPADLEEHYRRIGGGAVAVRSSAIGEDSEHASFAGQYDTVLDVRGLEGLRAAIAKCLESLDQNRATAYRRDQADLAQVRMSVVVQQMAQARAAGVLFTANPVNGRRDQLVVDAVLGLGDALVGGEITPDHFLIALDNQITHRECVASESVLSDAELHALATTAREAERRAGQPLDMEWAIDERGDIHWLQARPITRLPADLNELDIVSPADHVGTWCNIGEMMPGAVTPLTYSVTGRGIDVGMQRMYARVGVPAQKDESVPRYVSMYFGHFFLDLTELAEITRYVAGSDKEQMCIALCGRDVEELPAPKPASRPTRLYNGARYARMLFSAKRQRIALTQLHQQLELREFEEPRAMYDEIDSKLSVVWQAYEHHLISSAGSGALAPILTRILAAGGAPTSEHFSEVAAILAGASDVESADIATGADRIVDALAKTKAVQMRFCEAGPAQALAWLRSSDAEEAREMFDAYLTRHAHRAVRELEMRQPEWGADPTPLVVSLQSSVKARLRSGIAATRPTPTKHAFKTDSVAIRRLLPIAHAAVRSREHTKSLLVAVTAKFKRAYRHLGTLMANARLLPDPDAVFFLSHQELAQLIAGASDLSKLAAARREALPYQMPLQFEQVFVGKPEPLDPHYEPCDGELVGKPVSRGLVVGRARVVHTLEQAAELQAGEILVAPITDVGWTPYFGLISGLATDVGSPVSHGAVVAREYGLPAVVDLRHATTAFRTGDQVELDGDRGTLRAVDID